MTDRSHLSIGEVLSLLRDEFPDVTISKIRFLESQGLVDPERTPSGYRKFYEHDVERLRWILRQQRENFLPLKVIKGRLTDHDDDDTGGVEAADPTVELSGEPPGAPFGESGPVGDNGRSPAAGEAVPGVGGAEAVPGVGGAEAVPGAGGAVAVPGVAATGVGAGEPAGEPVLARSGGSGGGPSGASRSSAHSPGLAVPPSGPPFGSAHPPGSAVAPAPAPAPAPGPGAGGFEAGAPGSPEGEEEDSFTLDEIMVRSGLTKAQLDELTRYGLIAAQASMGGTSYYDREALTIATVSAGFAHHGVEARHLRAWRTAAEREVSLFEQVVIPLLRQRNPQARSQAAATLDELADLGAELREILVRRAVRSVH